MSAKDSVAGVVATPDDHERDVIRIWHAANEALSAVEQPLRQPYNSAILAAQERLASALINIWSLEGAAERAGVSRAKIVKAIEERKTTLALAHDLGNYVKHHTLNRTGRTGSKPELGPPQAKWGASGAPKEFTQSAFLDGREFSAVEVARQALGEWESLLRRWGLLR